MVVPRSSQCMRPLGAKLLICSRVLWKEKKRKKKKKKRKKFKKKQKKTQKIAVQVRDDRYLSCNSR